MSQVKVMTPEEALNLLDTASASVAMGRPQHIQCIQAVNILRPLIANGLPKVTVDEGTRPGTTIPPEEKKSEEVEREEGAEERGEA